MNEYNKNTKKEGVNMPDSELVLGLIYTVGTQISSVIDVFKDALRKFRYSVNEVNVSSQILSEFEQEAFSPDTEFARINHYMDLGNRIRKETDDNAILMKGVASRLYQERLNGNSNPQPRGRIAYLIRSIKHPDEISFLRQTYGDAFHLVGINSARNRRIKYLTEQKNMSSEEAEQLINRDANEDMDQGQHTRDAFQHADYFIDITADTDRTKNQVMRLMNLLFGHPYITPTFDEYAMFMAYATSLRSADLSRQVGAAIAKNNEILSMGTNDCPKYDGGLYWPCETQSQKAEYQDSENGRDYTRGCDSNKIEQSKLIENILRNLKIKPSPDKIQLVKRAGIGDLTEYGRVVHGEMEALLTCARNNISCREATLYVTTFPCHNCAKHIIAAGIKRVVYIEPYPKSKAFTFYEAEISDNPMATDKVIFEPFTGVGPQRYAELFAMSTTKLYKRKRKDKEGYILNWEPDKAELRTPLYPFNYIESEECALKIFIEETRALKEGFENG